MVSSMWQGNRVPIMQAWTTEGARGQTSCSRGLQASPALTLPLSEADVNPRGRETESALLWLNQVPVGKGKCHRRPVMWARQNPESIGTLQGLGTTHLSFTCQRKMVWGPQPGCSLRKFPSLHRQSRVRERA